MREIPIPPLALDPAWLSGFRTSLELADLAPATVAGYLKDVRQFLSWHAHEGGVAAPANVKPPSTSLIDSQKSLGEAGATCAILGTIGPAGFPQRRKPWP